MPTQTKVLTNNFQVLAQGPGTVYLQFEDDKGEWALLTSATAPSPGTVLGIVEHPLITREVVLAASTDFLHARGRGEARVAGTNLL